jgi:3'-phosphoadenosine 5'-phosphosulfate sulfotransferase (PAPS reductase)/FAD synthetase
MGGQTMSDQQIRHILLISGGKDSTALGIYMRDQHPEIEMEYLFCDTHKELPETYEYLTRIEAYLGQPITRLSSGLGERGFDHWLDMYRGFLPSASVRWCTRKLKIEPFEQYVGDDPVYLYVAIRGDENRQGYISTKPNITPLFPFKEAGITKADVLRILEESGIGLPEYYRWRTRSGCYFCFFQRRIEWVGLAENHPDHFVAAQAYEKPEEGYTWSQRESLEELAQPERMEQIRREEEKRRAQAAARRRPKTLAEMFTGETYDPDEEAGCLICHL